MRESQPIRVAIAADIAIYRRGLSAIVLALPEAQLVGEAHDLAEALQLCELVKPELLLLDVAAPPGALDPARQVHRRWPGLKVLALTASGAPPNGAPLGDVVYLPRDLSERALEEAIQRLAGDAAGQSRGAPHPQAHAEMLQALLDELLEPLGDRPMLAALLGHYLPLIFPKAQFWVRLFPTDDLVAQPAVRLFPNAEVGLRWLRTTSEVRCFLPGAELPWGGVQPPGSTFILAPILRGKTAVGGVGVNAAGGAAAGETLRAEVEAVARQIALALQREGLHPGQPTGEMLSRELVMAGRIQADILPDHVPNLPGWDLAAHLESARETSGDFFDFIPFSTRNLGLVIADVTDKGMGAALFMALSNTLIRTYAAQYPTLPALALGAVNQRILSDTRGNMFVTAFYGVLEPHTGRLRYVNAGHPPAHLVCFSRGRAIERLRATGMALGVMESAHWTQRVIKLFPGDVLLLYTDGVTEAQNPAGDFFGEERLLDVIFRQRGAPAREIQSAVMETVRAFVGDQARQDDIALMVVCRTE
jgi:serine phosphatase RsbU (regulator of sigma subunit)/CheY-like chemotaxis protein